jgi:hypothetical protein
MSLGSFDGSTSSCMGGRVGMGLVMAADFLVRVATDAVDNREETSFVTRGGGAAVLTMGDLLLSWYRSRREALPASKDGCVRRVFAISSLR